MNKIYSLLAIGLFALTAAACGSNPGEIKNPYTVGANGWVFEGWACAPDAIQAMKGLSPAQYCENKKKDYLYMKFSARASANAIRINSPGMKQSTCREASRLQVAADGLSKILGERIEKATGTLDGQSTGFAIIAQNKGILNGVGIYDCCAIDTKTNRCAALNVKEDWTECQCVGYMKFPGGQKGLITTARKILKERGE